LPPPSQDISHIIKQFRKSDAPAKNAALVWEDGLPSNARVAGEVNNFVTRNLESKTTDLKKFSESERKLKKLGKVKRKCLKLTV
jgi:hypothetical protein